MLRLERRSVKETALLLDIRRIGFWVVRLIGRLPVVNTSTYFRFSFWGVRGILRDASILFLFSD